MDQEILTAVGSFFEKALLGNEREMEKALQHGASAGLPAVQVSPLQGKMLRIFIEMMQAKRVLEIGTLGGYSTLWMAGAQVEGLKITTLEGNRNHASVAAENFKNAGVAEMISIINKDASEAMQYMIEAHVAPFDFIFIDADKQNNAVYLRMAKELSRKGTVIVADNVVRGGKILPSGIERSKDSKCAGIRDFISALGSDPLFSSTAVQTADSKGYDGFTLTIVTA